MTEQAPAPPAPPKPPPVGLRGVVGWVCFRLPSIRFKDGRQRPGVLLWRLRESGNEPPPFGAEAWHNGRKWTYEFGGRRIVMGDGRAVWEWAK